MRTVRDPAFHHRFGARAASGRLLAGAFVAALALHLLASIPASKWVGPKTVADLELDRDIRLRVPDLCCPGIRIVVSGERERQARWLEANRQAAARSLREASVPSPLEATGTVAPASFPEPLDIPTSARDGGDGADVRNPGPNGGGGDGEGPGNGAGAGSGATAPYRIDPEPTFVVPAMLEGGTRPKRTTTVSVRAWIDSTGVVTRVELAAGPDEIKPERALVSAALEAAARWRFHPAREGGHAVAATVLLPFRFDRK